ncbi:procathepsin L-like [Gracilinanus agilis]|uniref:procathepsin L-like n=1 Tax=Gracilinanus agilis TaxID=191870 RepID=UPI001CFEA1AD|nr:procathepsin L-like [Gracilinanus agilis]
MKFFLCLLFLCWGLSYCFSTKNLKLDTKWESWKTTYSKNYSEKEESFRRLVWEKNLKFINDHNRLYKEGKKTYFLGMNAFGDMTIKETGSMLNIPLPPVRIRRNTKLKKATYSGLPKRVDWRKHGFRNPVRNQWGCASCWAFSAVGAVEGQLFRKTGKLVELSKQMLIDCDRQQSCRGGFVTGAFKYMKNKGIVSEECYPYKAKKNKSCLNETNCPVTKIKKHVFLPSGKEQALMHAVATVGPVSVTVHAIKSFFYYRGGLYSETKCKKRQINHSLLVVGYGYEKKDENKKYWILKNSWGANWGKKGYMHFQKDYNNQCGIANYAFYPVL